jgi:hypothetical protein
LGFLPPFQSRHRGRKKKGEPGKRRRGGKPTRAAAVALLRRRNVFVKGRSRRKATFVCGVEPDQSRGTRAAVYADAAPPSLLRLHRRPTVSTVVTSLFSLRRSP